MLDDFTCRCSTRVEFHSPVEFIRRASLNEAVELAMKMLKPLKLRQALEQKDIWLEQMANLADKNAFMRKQASAGGRGCEDDAGR